MRKIGLVLSLAVFLPGVFSASGAGQTAKEQLDLLAEPLIEKGYTQGVVAAVIEGETAKIYGYGKVRKDAKIVPGANTIFEIGSVTKTFTALLLAELVEENSVKLSDPVQKFLPDTVTVPRKGKREITLGDLATHTSGLPRIPGNFGGNDLLNPYAGYTEEDMYYFLSGYLLPRAPGETYAYSNLGTGLLGHALARRAKKPLEALIREYVCLPLGMKDTGVRLSGDQQNRFAQGCDLEGEPVPHWDFAVLAGCGALRSTARDLIRYLKAVMGTADSPPAGAIGSTLSPRHPTDIPGGWMIGLGWHVDKTGDIAWHDGGTYGSYTYVGVNRKRNFGLVWLSNSGLWQIAPLRERLEKILLGEPILPLKLKEPVEVEAAILEQYTGRYQVKPGVFLELVLDEGYLVMRMPGQEGGSVLYPESENHFFFRESEDVTVSFSRDEKGRVRELIFHEGGEESPMKKTDVETGER